MTKTAKTYAGALYDLAVEEQLSEKILADLQLVTAVFRENPDYRKLLSEPSILKQERKTLLDEAWRGRIHLYTLNFLKLLCDNGTISQIADCEAEFRRRFYADNGILAVRAVSAYELKDPLRRKLREKLEALTGKRVELSVRVDENLIGGIRLDYDGKELDGTVRHHLDAISKTLKA